MPPSNDTDKWAIDSRVKIPLLPYATQYAVCNRREEKRKIAERCQKLLKEKGLIPTGLADQYIQKVNLTCIILRQSQISFGDSGSWPAFGH